MQEGIELEIKAENYTPEAFDKIELVGMVQNALESLVRETGKVASGMKNFHAVYVEGLYGSGKTFLMRKYSNEALKLFKNVIPIYVYLGAQDFKPFTILKSYRDIIELFIAKNRKGPQIVGSLELWKERFQILDKALKKGTESSTEDEFEKFYKTLEDIETEGYYPIIIFDEFERLLYTGEGIRSDEGRRYFAQFVERYLELVRGHMYRGIFVLVTTSSPLDLLKRAIDLRYPHVEVIEKLIGRPIREEPEQFPMISPHITYDHNIKISWTETELDLLANKYNLNVHTDLIRVIAKVLPTPRAMINIAHEALRLGIKNVVSLEDFMKIVKPRFELLKERLLKEKVEERFIITAATKWHETFEKLLEKGMLEIRREDYLNVAKVLGVTFDETNKISVRKAKEKVHNKLSKLHKIGLYDAKGASIYSLNKYVLAYLLNIDKLPTGEATSLETIINDIKLRIEEIKKEKKQKIKQTS